MVALLGFPLTPNPTNLKIMPDVKNCRNCAHCQLDPVLGAIGDYCILCGSTCRDSRRYPGPPCDVNLSGWVPRTLGQVIWDRRYLVASLSLLTIVLVLCYRSSPLSSQ
jgi:hypothetical protein